MFKVMLAAFAVFLVVGSVSAFQFREKMSSARMGSDVTYSVDAQGDASVEMSNKTYFVDVETSKNFDGMVTRLSQPDVQAFQKGVEDSLKNISDGREMSVSDFSASFERSADFGAQTYRFRWNGFAQRTDGIWAIGFDKAKPMKLTKDSTFVIVLPAGATLLKVEPAPTSRNGNQLTWTATGELSWPHVEYR